VFTATLVVLLAGVVYFSVLGLMHR